VPYFPVMPFGLLITSTNSGLATFSQADSELASSTYAPPRPGGQ
jgi:hypothetical protein